MMIVSLSLIFSQIQRLDNSHNLRKPFSPSPTLAQRTGQKCVQKLAYFYAKLRKVLDLRLKQTKLDTRFKIVDSLNTTKK